MSKTADMIPDRFASKNSRSNYVMGEGLIAASKNKVSISSRSSTYTKDIC
jgi:hypothetical protein